MLKVGTYNVRTLRAVNRHQFGVGCAALGIDVLAIQEHRKQSEEGLITHICDEGTFFLYPASKAGVGGIGIFISKQLTRITELDQVSDRIAMVTIAGNPEITIIGVYAPTEDKEVEVKDRFYSEVEAALAAIPTHNIVLLVGDLNARLGLDRVGDREQQLGRYLYHQVTNDNGDRLHQLARLYNLRHAQSMFPHRTGRMWTWTHANGSSRAQLDHILINKKWANSLTNCRAYNSLDLVSDHRIVIANIQVSLRFPRKQKSLPKINWAALEDEAMKDRFDQELRSALESEETEEPAINSTQRDYDKFVKSVRLAATKVLGVKKKQPKLPS